MSSALWAAPASPSPLCAFCFEALPAQKKSLCGRPEALPSAFLRTAADRLHQVENGSVFGLTGGRDEDVPRQLQRRPQLQSRALPGRKETWFAEPEAEH